MIWGYFYFRKTSICSLILSSHHWRGRDSPPPCPPRVALRAKELHLGRFRQIIQEMTMVLNELSGNVCKYHINTLKNQLNTFPSTNFMRLYQYLWVKHKVHSPHSFCISFLRPWQDFSEVAPSTHSTGLDGTAASRCSKSSRNFLRAVRFSESCSIGSKVKRVRRGRQRPCQLQGPWWPCREANCRKVSRSPPKLAAKSNWSPNKAPCKPTTWSVA